jgi:hypothetical protein
MSPIGWSKGVESVGIDSRRKTTLIADFRSVPQSIVKSCIKVSVCFMALALTLVSGRCMALGCPSGPDHWFNIDVTVDPASLPAGISAEQVSNYSMGTRFYLHNSTAIPLIVNPPDPDKVYFESYPRPLTIKLVSGEGYYCDVRTKPMSCEMNSRVNKFNELIDTPEIVKAVGLGWVAKDDRPLDVKIPPPQTFEFHALYGEKVIAIRGRISFSLNYKYDPKLGKKSKEWCDQICPNCRN